LRDRLKNLLQLTRYDRVVSGRRWLLPGFVRARIGHLSYRSEAYRPRPARSPELKVHPRDIQSILEKLHADLIRSRGRFFSLVDQVVAEHDTLPRHELYDGLKAISVNRGELDLDALRDNRPQGRITNPAGRT